MTNPILFCKSDFLAVMEKQENALAPYSRWLWSNTSAAGSGRTPGGRQVKAGATGPMLADQGGSLRKALVWFW